VQEASIAIVAPLQPEDFFDLLWQGVWEATFDLGPFGVQVRDLPSERYSVKEQQEILKQLLEDRVDGIAIAPAHVDALNPLIDAHQARGTPVVTFHGDAPASGRVAFVGPDAFRAGRLAGELLVKMMGGKGRVVAFPGNTEKHHLAQREQGFLSEVTKQTDGTVVKAQWPDTEVLSSAEGVYVGNEDLAEIAAALEKAGLRVPCIGFGNTESVQPFLRSQTISAVIDEQRYLQGYFAVQKVYEAIWKSAQGGAISGIRIPSDVAVAANAFEARDSLHEAFEMLLHQRTEALCSYKQRLEEANAELLNLAITDPLTGLLNRRKFEEVLESEVTRARRHGPLALLVIDLNLFKQVNDRYGHPAGDEVLKSVAGLLKSCCRQTDACARIGGDEFAVILPHTSASAAGIVRDRILKDAYRTKLLMSGQEVRLSLSIGIASLANESNAGGLIAAADADMYRVKQASRGELAAR